MRQFSVGSNWADLGPRVAAGLGMAGLAVVAIWAGGMVFVTLIAVVIGLCFWELSRLLQQGTSLLPSILGVIAAVCVEVSGYQLMQSGQIGAVWLTLFISPLIGFALLRPHRMIFLGYALLIAVAALGFLHLSHSGLVIWLVLVVITSDVAGYFAGRMIGGPKFWPKVSPKKTWSGTVAGWVGAAVIGVIFANDGNVLFWVVASILTAFAGQIGDIIESAIKRFVDVKDSSNLIPGHGGVLDRFDAMIGAAAVAYLLSALLAVSVFVAN